MGLFGKSKKDKPVKRKGKATASAPVETPHRDAAPAPAQSTAQPTEAAVRESVLTRFSQVVLSLINVPRYAHLPISDLQKLVVDPLVRNRIALANSNTKDSEARPLVGIAIWASVSDTVDQKIREQIASGLFPIRLEAEDWASGERIWLLDLVASSKPLATNVMTNFSRAVNNKPVSLHPMVSSMVDGEVLEKMLVRPSGQIH